MIQRELPNLSRVSASDPAVVVLSGGQDSMTCLALALARHETVHAVSFFYGQKHKTELVQATLVAKRLGVPHSVIDLGFFANMVTSELVGDDGDTTQPHAYKPGLPASFVPNRNALFLTLAHAMAQEVGAFYIYTGVCQTDYSGYPDCREAFILQMAAALNTGYETNIQIVTPMMNLTKAQTFAMADDRGVLDMIIEDSHTCYNGDRSHRHAWGYGCGHCPACTIRAAGYDAFMAATNAEPEPLARPISGEMADMVERITSGGAGASLEDGPRSDPDAHGFTAR